MAWRESVTYSLHVALWTLFLSKSTPSLSQTWKDLKGPGVHLFVQCQSWNAFSRWFIHKPIVSSFTPDILLELTFVNYQILDSMLGHWTPQILWMLLANFNEELLQIDLQSTLGTFLIRESRGTARPNKPLGNTFGQPMCSNFLDIVKYNNRVTSNAKTR